MKSRILITGAAGSIGKELVLIFIKKNFEVYALDKKLSPFNNYKNLKYIHKDLNNLSENEIEKIKPNYLVHLAASFQRSEETKDFIHTNFHDNIKATSHLIKILSKNKSILKFIYASSYLIYDKSLYLSKSPKEPEKLNEDSRVKTRNLIAASKIYGEEEVKFLKKFNPKIQIINLRIFRGYSKGCDSIVSRWVRDAINKKTLKIYNEQSSFDYIYSKDTADAIYSILLSNKKFPTILNLGSGKSIKINEVISEIKKNFRNIKTKNFNKKNEFFENSIADISKIKSLVSWYPKFSISKGVKKIIDYEKRRLKNKKTNFNILITSISNKSILINEVKKAAKRVDEDIKVFGCDLNDKILGKFLVDKFFKIENFNQINLQQLINLLKKEDIKLIIPTSDLEIIFWSKVKNILQKQKIFIAISSHKTCKICSDKYLFYNHCIKNKFNSPCTSLREKKKLQNVIKERFSFQKRAVLLLNQQHKKNLFKNPIYQEKINLPEISIDCFVDKENEIYNFFARKRLIIQNNEAVYTKFFVLSDKNKKIILKFLKSLNFYGHINLQAFYDKKKDCLSFFDCNPRFGGASTIALRNNIDSFYWYILKALNKKIYIKNNNLDIFFHNQIIIKNKKIF